MAANREWSILHITSLGKPQAKGRPRHTRGHTYTSDRTRGAEDILRAEMRRGCSTPLEGPLKLEVFFRFHRPKSWPAARRDVEGEEPWYKGKPDLDNLLKLVMDAANGILWHDDAQVVKVIADKVYSDEDATELVLTRVEAP